MTKRTLSVLLTICLLLTMMPGTAMANTVSNIPFAQGNAAPTDNEIPLETAPVNKNITVLHEDEALRQEYEKHFLMSDGSYQVALYNEPVHKLESGKWVEIDNTLTLRSTRDGNARYVTANGVADVSFARDFGDQLVTVRQDDYAVSWGVAVFSDEISSNKSAALMQPVRAEVTAAELTAYSEEEQKIFASKATSALQYRGALASNADLEYIVTPSRIKENIILQSRQDIAGYTVTVYTENLSARLLENREIEYYNSDNEVIFTMTSPYMYDSAGELSEEIGVTLLPKGDGCYEIQMTPDTKWLSSPDRVYPVVLDPQVSVSTVRSNIIDNYVLEGSGNQNRNLDRLYIGKKSGKIARAYIKYATMPTLPEDAEITDATMSLTMVNGTSTAANANAWQVTSGDWESNTITWANKPSSNTRLAANISHNNKTGYSFSCRAAVRTWYFAHPDGTKKNYGVMLCYYDETIADYNAVYSADCSTASKRPSLTIFYNGSDIGSDDGSDSGADDGPDFSSAITITLDAQQNVETLGSNEEKFYKFVAPVKAEYLFYSSNAEPSGDPYITVYSSDGTIVAYDDNTGGDLNFRVSVPMEKGATRYIGVKHSSGKSGSFNLNVLIEYIAGGEVLCHLRNVGTSLYLDSDDLENAYHGSYRGDTNAQWTIKRQTNGYYLIESVLYDGCCLGVDDSEIGSNNIVLSYTIDDYVYWKIYVRSTGEMFIEPKQAKGAALYAPSNSSNTELQLTYISSSVLNRNKWKIECVSNTPLEGQRQDTWCWAAASRMFAKHYSSGVTRTQAEAVAAISNDADATFGNGVDDGYAAVLYYLKGTNAEFYDFMLAPNGTGCLRYSEETLRRFINDGHVIWIGRAEYKNATRFNGHASLIAGYTTIYEKGILQYRYVINDPWPPNTEGWVGDSNTLGEIKVVSYGWICNGQSTNGEDYQDDKIWDSFIVKETGYCTNVEVVDLY